MDLPYINPHIQVQTHFKQNPEYIFIEKQEKKRRQRNKRKHKTTAIVSIPANEIVSFEKPVQKKNRLNPKQVLKRTTEEPVVEVLEDLVREAAETLDINFEQKGDHEQLAKVSDLHAEDFGFVFGAEKEDALVLEHTTPNVVPEFGDKLGLVASSSSTFDISPLFEDHSVQVKESSTSSFEMDVLPLFEELGDAKASSRSSIGRQSSSSSFEFDVRPFFEESQLPSSSSSFDVPPLFSDLDFMEKDVNEIIPHAIDDFSDIFDEPPASDLVFVQRPIFDSSTGSDETFIHSEEVSSHEAPSTTNDPFGIHVNVLSDGSILASASHRSHPPSLPPSSPRSTSSYFLISEDEGFEGACKTMGCLFPGGWSSVHLRGPTYQYRNGMSSDEFFVKRDQQQRGGRVDRSSMGLEALWMPFGGAQRRGTEGNAVPVPEGPRELIEQQRRAYRDMSSIADMGVKQIEAPLENSSLPSSSSSSSSEEFMSSVRNRFRTLFADHSDPTTSSSTSSEGPLALARRSISEFFSTEKPRQPYIPVPQPRSNQVHTVSTTSKDEEGSTLFPGLSLWTRRFRDNTSSKPKEPRGPRQPLFSGIF